MSKEDFGLSQIAFLQRGVFTKEECDKMISEAQVTGSKKPLPSAQYFPNQVRRTIEKENWAQQIDERIGENVPSTIEAGGVTYKYKKVRPTFTYVHYTDGGSICAHIDCHDGDCDALYITALLYLNDDYKGGETYFEKSNQEVQKESGAVLCFDGNGILHGCRSVCGEKHILLTGLTYVKE